jgi:hypothetical protein
LASKFWRRRFFKFFYVFLFFRYYHPLERSYPLSLKTIESSPSKDDLCQVWLKLAQWFWRRRFINDTTPFLHFCDYLPFEEDLALYLNKLEFPLPKDNCTKFDSIWPAGSGKEDFSKFSVHFHSFAIISPWRKTIPFC